MPFVNLNGQEIFYEDSGGSGKPIVFMHGFLFDQAMFDKQVAALTPKYRCVRFDARGFGQTKWDGKQFTLYDTVADCISLMNYLNIDKAVIAGMSQGGYAALRVAVKHPERVTALVFMSTYNAVDSDDFKAAYYSIAEAWRTNGPDTLLPMLFTQLIGPKEATGNLWDVWQPKAEKLTGEQITATIINLTDRDDVTAEQVQKINVPVLSTHGEEDRGIPISFGRALYEAMPNAKKFVEIKGAAHAANLTHADIVNAALLEFLDEYA